MVSRSVISLVVVLSFLLVTGPLAVAEQFTAGTGQNIANLDISWSDGYSAQFTVRFDSTTVTGLNLLDIVEASTGFTTVRLYGGAFINGISFNGHSNSGYGGGADWWHYWIKDNGQTDWTSPAFGASDHTVYSGDSDGWVYGNDGAPVPEPATIVLLGLGGLVLRKFRK